MIPNSPFNQKFSKKWKHPTTNYILEYQTVAKIGSGSYGVAFLMTKQNGDKYIVKVYIEKNNPNELENLYHVQGLRYINSVQGWFASKMLIKPLLDLIQPDDEVDNKFYDTKTLKIFLKLPYCEFAYSDIVNSGNLTDENIVRFILILLNALYRLWGRSNPCMMHFDLHLKNIMYVKSKGFPLIFDGYSIDFVDNVFDPEIIDFGLSKITDVQQRDLQRWNEPLIQNDHFYPPNNDIYRIFDMYLPFTNNITSTLEMYCCTDVFNTAKNCAPITQNRPLLLAMIKDFVEQVAKPMGVTQ
jgi:serine/threonine protein kinase